MMNRQQGIRAKLKSRQQGAVAIIVALCLTVLVGMIGLVVDLGHMFIIKTELQNAADSCALAAARELDGTADSLLRAENAGITVGQRNNVDLQNESVSILDSDVTFSVANDSYVSRSGGAAASSNYVKCTLRLPDIAMWFMQALGFGNQAVGATAVAALQPSQTSCAIPLGVCQTVPNPLNCEDGSVPDSRGMCVGQWYSGKFEAGAGETGSFNWIDFTPNGGGTKELADILAGPGQCNLAITNKVGEPGGKQALEVAWNSRFGIYKPGGGNPNNPEKGQPNLISAAPDFTGHAYTTTSWAAGRNALSDFLAKRETHTSYTGDMPSGYEQPADATQLEAYGSNRRLVTAPLINCEDWKSANQVSIVDWACILMLHPIIDGPQQIVTMEYRGLSNLANSPCATFGVPGGTAGPLVPVLVQ